MNKNIAGKDTGQGGTCELVFRNGRVYTVNPKQPWAEAVAISDGRFVRIGSNRDVEGLIGSGTEVVDLGGRLVIPGLYDSHVHLITAVHFARAHCVLPDPATNPGPEDYLAAIKRFRAEGRGVEDGWFFGGVWSALAFGKKGPTKEMLDEIIGDTPTYLVDTSIHAAWVNSAALRVAGIDRNTPDPQYGLIVRDPRSGEPTGYLIMYSAMAMVGRHLPKLPTARRMKLAERGIAELNSYGVIGFIEAGSTEADLVALNQLAREGRLNARVLMNNLAVQDGSVEKDLPTGEAIATLAKKYRTGRLMTSGAKVYVDGLPMNDTVAFLDRKVPFRMPNLDGDLTISAEKLKQVVSDLDRNGVQVMMHCMGDKAVRVALEAIEAARNTNGMNELHHMITHAPQVRRKDMERFAGCGACLSIQTWLSTDNDYRFAVIPVAGEETWNNSFRYKTMLKSGACISIGSDWPCGPSNPYPLLCMASTRIDPLHPERGVFNEQECLTMEELLPMLTLNGAKLMHMEDVSGSIEEGKFADLVVLDRNIMDCAPQELLGTRVLVTLLEGKPVYHAEDSPMVTPADQLKKPEMWR